MRPGPKRTCHPQGTKAEPPRPLLLQPEDESRGLSGECGPRRPAGKVGEGVALARSGVGGSGWAGRGRGGRGDQSVPGVLPGPARWSSGTQRPHRLPAQRRAGAELPQPRGSPLGGNRKRLREKSKAEAPQAAVQGTRWRAAGCEAGGVGCSVRKVLGGAQRRGRGPCAAQVAAAARGRTPGGGGRPGAPGGLPDIETGGFCFPLPAEAGFALSHLTLSDLEETTSSEAAALRLAGWRRGSQLSSFEVLRVSQHVLGFLFFSGHLRVQKPGKLAGEGCLSPVSVILPHVLPRLMFSFFPLSLAL